MRRVPGKGKSAMKLYLLMKIVSDQYGTTAVAGVFESRAMALVCQGLLHGQQTWIKEISANKLLDGVE
jgi:hypothetical protein